MWKLPINCAEKLSDNKIWIDDDIVKLKQWKNEEKNKTNLLLLEMSVEEFIEELCRQI